MLLTTRSSDTAVIQIDVHGAIRESRLVSPHASAMLVNVESPLLRNGVIRQRDLRHLLQQRQVRARDLRLATPALLVTDVGDVVEIVRPAIDAIGDEEILVAIVVQIGKERRPAPVGGRDAGEKADVAEVALRPRFSCSVLRSYCG